MSKQQRCFACKESFQERHSFYSGWCGDCGEFNYAKRNETANFQGLFAKEEGRRCDRSFMIYL